MIDPFPWRAWVTLYGQRPVTCEYAVSTGYRETLTRYEVEQMSIHRSLSRDTICTSHTGS